MVALVQIDEKGFLVKIKEVSDKYQIIPYNWDEDESLYAMGDLGDVLMTVFSTFSPNTHVSGMFTMQCHLFIIICIIYCYTVFLQPSNSIFLHYFHQHPFCRPSRFWQNDRQAPSCHEYQDN